MNPCSLSNSKKCEVLVFLWPKFYVDPISAERVTVFWFIVIIVDMPSHEEA
jgi:hypothetical protein